MTAGIRHSPDRPHVTADIRGGRNSLLYMGRRASGPESQTAGASPSVAAPQCGLSTMRGFVANVRRGGGLARGRDGLLCRWVWGDRPGGGGFGLR